MAMMMNHHTGLIGLAQQVATRATDDSVKSIARNLATAGVGQAEDVPDHAGHERDAA